MEHILEHYVYGYSANLRGFVFGFFHAAIMILGYYTGWSINRMLKIISNGYIAGIFGADYGFSPGETFIIWILMAILINQSVTWKK